MIELFLNHWMSSSHSISHWINYVRILTCSSLMLQLLKTTCCLNSSLATLAWIPSNLWHHTHSIIKSLVVLCLLACLLFFLKGVLCWKMHTKVVQMLFVSEQGFQSSYLWLQMFILMGYCAILAARTSVALYVCSQRCQHIAFGDIILVQLQWNWSLGKSKKCNTCRSPGGVLAEQGAKLVGVGWEQGWDKELSLATTGCAGSLFYRSYCNKQKGGFIKHFWEPRKILTDVSLILE